MGTLRWLACLLWACLCLSAAAGERLFPYANTTGLPTLHRSLDTLLPVLPRLVTPASNTLLVTLATPPFKPLLYNWLCFVRGKAKWGAPARSHGWDKAHARPFIRDEDDPALRAVPPVLVITSSVSLAEELSELGLVVWLLDPAHSFRNARELELLADDAGALLTDAQESMIRWGTLHYQSLMLERSLALAALTGALVEQQYEDEETRQFVRDEYRKRWLTHDWRSPLPPTEWHGVKGVLLVDNDAAWLASPEEMIDHHFRPGGSHPSFVYASDTSTDKPNAFGRHSMPCACFIYARTADTPTLDISQAVLDTGAHIDARLAPRTAEQKALPPSPAAGAALGWRYTALCHIAVVQQALVDARRQAARLDKKGGAHKAVRELTKGKAPSFQATALGPALRLAELGLDGVQAGGLPDLSHHEWMHALESGDGDDLLELLERAGLTTETCLQKAQAVATQCVPSDAPESSSPLSTSLDQLARIHQHGAPAYSGRRVRSEMLPYASFPPGKAYFGHELPIGVSPCVVHANYAVGPLKEELLKREQLWALGREPTPGATDEPEGADAQWVCRTP